MKLRNTILLSTLLLVTGVQANAATTLELEERIAKLEAVLAHIDADNDNFSPNQGDCDDSDSGIHPEANESDTGTDGIDNDCDGTIDEDDYYEASYANDDSYAENGIDSDDSTSYSSSNDDSYNDDSRNDNDDSYSNDSRYDNDDSYNDDSHYDNDDSYTNDSRYDNDDSYDNDDRYDNDGQEVKGRIISLSSNLMTLQVTKVEGFRISGNTVTVDFSNARFKNGSVSNLGLNRYVEVEGYWTGTVLVASKVDFD